MNASSAKQSRDPKVWFATQGNVPRAFVEKDKHPESTGQRKAL